MNNNGTNPSLDEMDQYVAELQEKAQKLTEDLTEAVGKARSQDGAVIVEVNASGVVQKLELTNRASEHTPTQLASLIMQTLSRAQRAVGEQVAEAIESFGGPGGATGLMQQYLSYQPPSEEDDQPSGESAFDPPEPDPEPEQQTPPAAPPAPKATRRPTRPTDDDEDDDDRPW
ncbi:MAG TPA: YbaB/EbfC family nucleoid-associated protein [Pseudonocardiaceae bacterium]